MVETRESLHTVDELSNMLVECLQAIFCLFSCQDTENLLGALYGANTPLPYPYYCYHIESELNVLKSGYYKSPLDYNDLDWFVSEVIKLENKLAFYFKNTKKDIIMTQKDKEHFFNNKICRKRNIF